MIKKVLESPDHCRITPFTFELRLCDKTGCVICIAIGRTPRTPNVQVNGKNLLDKTLRWIDLPVPNPSNQDHYLPPKEAREAIEKSLSFDQLKSHIPNVKTDTVEQMHLKKAKEADKKRGRDAFHAPKVRAVTKCDCCGGLRVLYSKNQVGSAEGPTKKKLEDVLLLLEDGYVCGNSIGEATGFYVRTAIQCGSYIESQYYNPSTGLKGGRMVTEDICAISYDEDDILLPGFL